MRTGKRLLATAGLAAVATSVLLGLTAGAASAHPLGNFTINRYARVELAAGAARVYYVLDEAEIPAFEDRDALTADRNGFIGNRVEQIRRGLRLTVGGRSVDLTAAETLLTEPKGQGGLHTLRLAVRFDGMLVPHSGQTSEPATFADDNEPNRVGWREIVVTGAADTKVVDSNAPSHDVTNELRSYPADLVQSPLDLRRATFSFVPGHIAVAPVPLSSPSRAPSRADHAFADLITRNVTPLALVGMVGLALLFGAGHALAPGHGKTVMAAYLVGTRGRPIDAVLLGTIVSAMHTASVLVLALVLYQVDRSTSLDRLYPVLTIASGVIVAALGVYMLVSRMKRRHPKHVHAHAHHHHDHHPHGHDHHDHDHALPEDVSPLSRRGLVLLATSGGLLPSPSAVLVLVGAFAAGRSALGLGLVAAFSVGLAVTLMGIGLALVFGGRALERRGLARPGITRWLPIGSALAITAVGTVVATQGVARL